MMIFNPIANSKVTAVLMHGSPNKHKRSFAQRQKRFRIIYRPLRPLLSFGLPGVDPSSFESSIKSSIDAHIRRTCRANKTVSLKTVCKQEEDYLSLGSLLELPPDEQLVQDIIRFVEIENDIQLAHLIT